MDITNNNNSTDHPGDHPEGTVLQIAKWDEVFETAETRKYQRLRWVPLPVDLTSNGYESLLEDWGDDAPALYGAWCALLSVAATCPTRGILSTSRGKPIPTRHLARKTGFPEQIFEKLINWATMPEIGWLVESTQVVVNKGDPHPACSAPGDLPVISRSSPGRIPDKSGLTRLDQTRPDQTRLDQTTNRPDQTRGIRRSVGRWSLDFPGRSSANSGTGSGGPAGRLPNRLTVTC